MTHIANKSLPSFWETLIRHETEGTWEPFLFAGALLRPSHVNETLLVAVGRATQTRESSLVTEEFGQVFANWADIRIEIPQAPRATFAILELVLGLSGAPSCIEPCLNALQSNRFASLPHAWQTPLLEQAVSLLDYWSSPRIMTHMDDDDRSYITKFLHHMLKRQDLDLYWSNRLTKAQTRLTTLPSDLVRKEHFTTPHL